MMGPLTGFAQQLRALALDIERVDGQEREARLHSLPYEAQLWLAVVPAWTFALGKAARFPDGGRGLEALVEALRDEGLCEIENDPSKRPGARRFWMPAAMRSGFLLAALRRPGPVRVDPAQLVGEIGRGIVGARGALPADALPPLIDRWATLAQHAPSENSVASELAARVDECLRPASPDTTAGRAEQRPARALDWIEAARPLGDVLGGALLAAIRQQGRRVDLVYRRREDQRQLTHFLERAEPMAAFERLIAGPGDEWALHFIGAGGVGKTMLMRWLGGRWAEKAGAATARIDFDYLNPEFPSRAPALLLAQLMQDLRLHADDTADREFGSFESKMLALHERARAAPPAAAGERPPGFEEMLQTFADAVRLLDRRVVLLLDTCEELSKARLSGSGLPENVRATFEILEMLHDALPDMRVVFCGRRPLAGAGAGWSIDDSRYPARPYLTLFEVRGFTRDEAMRYLTSTTPDREDLVAAILRVSEDPAAKLGIRVGAGRPSAGVGPRYAPFMLNLYARWAQEDEALTATTILSGDTDPYIESRVVRRVRRQALMDLLPVMALVGRFDVELLRAVSTRSGTELEEAIGELQEQDWAPQQADGFFEVKPHLRPRLLAYLERTGRTLLAATRARATDHLTRVTLELPAERLAVAHFEAAARLLEPDSRRALDWWDRVEARIGRDVDLAWARRLVEWLLSDDGAVMERADARGEHQHPLRASVLATYANLLLHADEPTRLIEIWQEVEKRAPMDERPGGAERLRLRARAGTLAAAWPSGIPPTMAHGDAFAQGVEAALAAGLDARGAAAAVAGFEALVETTERSARLPDIEPWYQSLLRVAQALPDVPDVPDLVAFGASLAARACRLHDEASAANAWWDVTLDAVGGAPSRATSVRLDWRAPTDLRARVQLEFARDAWPALRTPARVLACLDRRIRQPDSTDADRLAAIILVLRGARKSPDTSDVRPWVQSPATPASTEQRCNAHRRVPPLRAVYWETLALAEGHADAALEALQGDIGRAETALVLPWARAMECARLRIGRHLRLRDEERVNDSLGTTGATIEEATLLHALLAFDGRSRPADRLPATRADVASLVGSDPAREGDVLHLCWRSIPAVTFDGRRAAVEWAGTLLPPPSTPAVTYAEIACRLDAVEAHLLAADSPLAPPHPGTRGSDMLLRELSDRVERWNSAHPLDVEAHYRLRVRLMALDGDDDGRSDIDRAASRCGSRGAAAIALDEGELLALRLPAAGIRLLGFAGRRLEEEKDRYGALRAYVAQALAAIRCGNRERLDDALDAAVRVYRTLASTPWSVSPGEIGRILPPLETIEKAARQPSLSDFSALAPAVWRPWLVRMIAALAWKHDGAKRGARGEVVAGWLAAHYGALDASTAELTFPPELAPWTPQRTIVVRAGNDAAASVQAGMPAGRGHATARVPDEDVQLLHLRITSRAAQPVPPRETLEVAIDAELGGMRLAAGTRFRLVGASPYFESAIKGPAPELGITLPPGGGAVVELTVDHVAANGCWEALFTDWLAGTARVHADAPRPRFLRRTQEARGLRDSMPWPGLSLVKLRTLDPALSRSFYATWDGAGRQLGRRVEVDLGRGAGQSVSAPSSDEALAVVHVMGTPVQTGFGDVALQLAPSVGGTTTVFHGGPSGGSGGSGGAVNAPYGGAARGGGLLKMRDLRHEHGPATLVLLQANPTSGRARTTADRECAGMLRMMASELSSRGTPAVLTVPPMPVADALRAVEGIAREIARPGPSIRDVLLKATEAAGEVARHSTLDFEDARAEAAADFCLYLAHAAAMR